MKDYRITTIMDENIYSYHIELFKKAGLKVRGPGALLMDFNSEMFNKMLEYYLAGEHRQEYDEMLIKYKRLQDEN